jgi:protein-S-isoprenylcysteine O-methyltransferase Ste14
MPHPILLGFLVAYTLLHSLLASQPCKAWARRRWGTASDRWYRLAYNGVAVVTLLPLLPLLAWLPDHTLYVAPAPWRWLLLAGQGVAVLGVLAALRQTDMAHFLGVRQLRNPTPAAESPLTVRGFYASVRHPTYTFGLLALWLSPLMTANLLTVYLFWSLYMYLGSFHEERRLLQEFGEAYRTYQQQVPRLIPRLPRRRGRLTMSRHKEHRSIEGE